jgi:hypothetical protein
VNRYSIRKILVWPAFKFGAVIGAVLMIVPGILWGLMMRSSVHALRTFVEGMGWLTLNNRDMAALAQRVADLDQLGPMLAVWVALATVIIGGLVYGLGAAVAALLYNAIAGLSGGLVVGIEAPPQPQPAPAPPQAGSVVQPQAAAPAAQAPQMAPSIASSAQPVAPVVPAQPQTGPWLAIGTPAQRRPLRPDRTRLGSAADNDIVLSGVNAYHAEIRFEDGIYVLYDMAAGQTWVNNRPVAGRNMLKEGFVIRLGGQEMVFHAA